MSTVARRAADPASRRDLAAASAKPRLRDAADFWRSGLGHCFARPWKSAKGRYKTLFAVLREVLRIAPADRRFYGVL